MDQQTRELLERIRRFAMPEGPGVSRGSWLRQVGEMRQAPDRPWLPFVAEQSFAGGGVDFRWLARVRMAPFVHVKVVDAFEMGHGMLTVRLLGFIPVARSQGPAVDKGEAQRALAEQPWRPVPFAETPYITWATTPAGKLHATFDDGRTRASVEFDVGADGRVLGANASDRPRIVGKEVVETAWSGTFGDYRKFSGLYVPTQAKVTWHLPEGPFTYWRGRLSDFRVVHQAAGARRSQARLFTAATHAIPKSQ